MALNRDELYTDAIIKLYTKLPSSDFLKYIPWSDSLARVLLYTNKWVTSAFDSIRYTVILSGQSQAWNQRDPLNDMDCNISIWLPPHIVSCVKFLLNMWVLILERFMSKEVSDFQHDKLEPSFWLEKLFHTTIETSKLKKLTDNEQKTSMNINKIICCRYARLGEPRSHVSQNSNLFEKLPFSYGIDFQGKNWALFLEIKNWSIILDLKNYATRLWKFSNWTYWATMTRP